ncbi:restriction endonuclease fold toxin-2 domain-containing protein [Streptomyces sp. NBC_01497]|uniref:restriction endonuclease fold toxin-2 domain-containing protein n=1 Tax=Streptomyces sp. NBC_01497 TaxID=2903885 RepID=UPI002E329516|nr:restriction endonuclease fold toxin-2 domain-containing protein [Streptomyces sp. NBC_01497]
MQLVLVVGGAVTDYDIDIDPVQVALSSAGFADLQVWASQIYSGLIGSLGDASGMAGDDDAGHAFGAVYDPAAQKVSDALAKSVAYMGGAANTLYTMSANYLVADAQVLNGMRLPAQLPASSNPDCDSEPRPVEIPTAVGHQNWAVRHIIAKFWPQGDPDALRQAGRDWQRLAGLLTTLGLEGDRHVAPVTSESQASDVKAFEASWQRVHIDCTVTGPVLNTLSTTAHQLSQACDTYAQKIDSLRSHLTHMAELAGGVAAVGIGLTILTLGVSDAAAAGGEAAIVSEASAAALAMTAELEADAELAVLTEAAAIVDAAAARIVIPAVVTAAVAGTTVLLDAATASAAPGPAGLGTQPLPRDPGSPFPQLPTAGQAAVRQWMLSMQGQGRSTPALQPTTGKPKIDARRAYQLRVAGSTEYNLYTTVPNGKGGERGMNADGVRASDGAAVDAKYVGTQKSCTSPLRLGNVDNVPSYVYESAEKAQKDEIMRYGAAFKDPRNQVNHMEIITNDAKAGAYFDVLLAAEKVPGETRIVP